MKKIIHFLCLSAALVWFTGCQKEYPKTSIDYYITANQSEEYNLLSFNLLWTTALTKGALTSVYLDPAPLAFDTSQGSMQDTVYLGQSDIEPGLIDAYTFRITGGRGLWQGQSVILRDKEYYESNEAPAGFTIQEGEIKKVLFVVNVDSSIIRYPDRTFKLLPRIEVVAE
jgi:hypothetical protein